MLYIFFSAFARRDPAGKSGLDYVVHFVAKLLEPSGSDSEAFFVGDLILTIIKKVDIEDMEIGSPTKIFFPFLTTVL